MKAWYGEVEGSLAHEPAAHEQHSSGLELTFIIAPVFRRYWNLEFIWMQYWTHCRWNVWIADVQCILSSDINNINHTEVTITYVASGSLQTIETANGIDFLEPFSHPLTLLAQHAQVICGAHALSWSLTLHSKVKRILFLTREYIILRCWTLSVYSPQM